MMDSGTGGSGTAKRAMSGDVRATLAAWRDSGADRLDPVRFHFIEALARRSADRDGEARRLLDERLAALIGRYADDLERTAVAASEANRAVPVENAAGPLAALVDDIARRRRDAGLRPVDAAVKGPAGPQTAGLVEYFRSTWARLSAERELRQSQQRVPEHAGPLNSSQLVHRALALMQELSPGYLEQFLSYVDTLSRLERLNPGLMPAAPPGGDTRRAAGTRKSGPRAARKAGGRSDT